MKPNLNDRNLFYKGSMLPGGYKPYNKELMKYIFLKEPLTYILIFLFLLLLVISVLRIEMYVLTLTIVLIISIFIVFVISLFVLVKHQQRIFLKHFKIKELR